MLTDKQCKNATCPADKKRARFTDSSGLYLEVSPTGSKRWFWKMYVDGKEGRMALGSYPAASLADARKARNSAKRQKADGHNPVQVRKTTKLLAINPAFVASLGRAGGNVTGLAASDAEINAKQWQMLRDTVPGARRIGWLIETGMPGFQVDSQIVQRAAIE